MCDSCELPLTIKHILVECTNLQHIREKYFAVSSIEQLFDSDFIKETHFYSQL